MAELFAYLDGFGTSGGFTKSIIIVTGLQTGAVVTANGWTKNAAFAEPNCAEEAYKSLFSNVRFENVPVGTKTTLVVVIYAAEKSRCYLQEDIGFGSRQYFDLKPGDNYIKIPVTTVGELPGYGVTCVFYKVDDTVQVCGKQMRLYTQEVEKIAIEKNGEWWLKNLDIGEWTLKATLDDQSATTTFNIERFGVYYVSMAYRFTPDFTYTGKCEVVDDNDNSIEDFSTWKGNWKFRFLTSGTLTITKMNSFDGYVDMFLVGGAGGGGTANTYGGSGGGRTTTVKHVLLKVGVPYQITIGAGGEVDKNGGYTTIIGDTINKEAVGGYAPDINDGGWGGSGGAAGWTGDETPGKPGVDGSDGTDGSYWKGGEGQHTTTREFGEPTGKLYSTGGESSRSGNTAAGAPNTGDGSGANKRGGSGILVLRNSRAA